MAIDEGAKAPNWERRRKRTKRCRCRLHTRTCARPNGENLQTYETTSLRIKLTIMAVGRASGHCHDSNMQVPPRGLKKGDAARDDVRHGSASAHAHRLWWW